MSPNVHPLLDAQISIVPSATRAALPLTAGGLVVAGAFVGGGLLLIGGIVALAYRSGDARVDRVADALDGYLPPPTDA
ncbi:hypothetical protein DJ72_05775, partial [Halorubrum distributum]